jgi:hypothetical protein
LYYLLQEEHFHQKLNLLFEYLILHKVSLAVPKFPPFDQVYPEYSSVEATAGAEGPMHQILKPQFEFLLLLTTIF